MMMRLPLWLIAVGMRVCGVEKQPDGALAYQPGSRMDIGSRLVFPSARG